MIGESTGRGPSAAKRHRLGYLLSVPAHICYFCAGEPEVKRNGFPLCMRCEEALTDMLVFASGQPSSGACSQEDDTTR